MFFNLINLVLKIILKIFFVVFFAGKKNDDRRAEKIIKLYESNDFSGTFTKIRLWDAPFKQIEKLVPKKGLIIDLGCGDGIMSNYLAIEDPKRKIIGIELNKGRIKVADKGLKNTKFISGDILKKDVPSADIILLLHVFHHLLSFNEQELLIKKIYQKLKKNGKLIIAEIDTKPFLKYWFTYLVDVVVVPILFEGKIFSEKIFYRSEKEWMNLLTNNGFKCKVVSMEKGKPFSHITFECIKR